jgi:heme A synthase
MAPTGVSDEDEAHAAKMANRFDIRRIIGGLFLVYSVVLIVTGLVGDHVVKNKASGINVNLYTGIGMLLFAIFMIAWALLRPTRPEPPETRGEGSGRIRRAPAT